MPNRHESKYEIRLMLNPELREAEPHDQPMIDRSIAPRPDEVGYMALDIPFRKEAFNPRVDQPHFKGGTPRYRALKYALRWKSLIGTTVYPNKTKPHPKL